MVWDDGQFLPLNVVSGTGPPLLIVTTRYDLAVHLAPGAGVARSADGPEWPAYEARRTSAFPSQESAKGLLAGGRWRYTGIDSARCRDKEVEMSMGMSILLDRAEACSGLWLEVDRGFGYCQLGEGCRFPYREAHLRRVVGCTVDTDED